MRSGRWIQLLAVAGCLSGLANAGEIVKIYYETCSPSQSELPTVTSMNSAPTGTGAATEYLLQAVAPIPGRKRQLFTAQYLGPNGQVVGNCTSGLKFTFENQELLSGGLPVAIAPGVDNAPLQPNSAPGATITTAFSINGTRLFWYNQGFGNGGFATFCLTSSNVVDAVFQGSDPQGCGPVNIEVVLASTCPGYIPPSNTVSSPTTGPTGTAVSNSSTMTGQGGSAPTNGPTGGSTPTTSVTSTITATAPATVIGSGGTFTRRGCYNDLPTGEPLDGPSFTSPVLTLEDCASFCAPYIYFGATNGDICICGNSLASNAYPNFDVGACGVICSGQSRELCGDAQDVLVYSILSRASSIVPTSIITASPASFTVTTSSSSTGSSSSSTSTGGSSGISSSSSPSTSTSMSSSVNSTSISTSTSTSTGVSTGSTSTATSTSTTNFTSTLSTTRTSSTTTTTSFPTGSPTGYPVCPDGDQTYFTTGDGRTYFTQCQIDHSGNDLLPAITVASLEECINACDAYTPGAFGPCLGVSLVTVATTNNCYLKYSISPAGPDAVVDSAILVSGPGASTGTTSSPTITGPVYTPTGSSSLTTDYPCPSFDNSVFHSDGSHDYNIKCRTNLPGVDINKQYVGDLQDCINVCNLYNAIYGASTCKGVVFTRNSAEQFNCFLRGTVTSVTAGPLDDETDAAILICQDCPSPTVVTSTASSTTTTTSTSGTSTSTGSTTTTSPVVPPAATPSLCPAQNNTSYASSHNHIYTILCGDDFYGNDIVPGVLASSLQQCAEFCDDYNTNNPHMPACVGATLREDPPDNYPNCYLKSSLTSTPNRNQALLDSIVLSSAFYSNPCPSQNGAEYSTPGGHFYEIYCGVDYDAGTLAGGESVEGSLQECAQNCDTWNAQDHGGHTCVGVSWQEQRTGQNPNCFLKETLSAPTNVNGIDTAVRSNTSPRLILSHPSPLIVNTPGSDYSNGDTVFTTLPFPIRLYGRNDTLIWVSSSGLLSLSNQNGLATTNGNLPSTLIPASTAMPFWMNSAALQGTQQGVYYQIDGTTVSFEYFLTDNSTMTQTYHYIIFYDSAKPGIISFYYFTATDAGAHAVIGTQGIVGQPPDVDNLFSQNMEDVGQGTVFEVNTNIQLQGSYSFDTTQYPAGTWPNGV